MRTGGDNINFQFLIFALVNRSEVFKTHFMGVQIPAIEMLYRNFKAFKSV